MRGGWLGVVLLVACRPDGSRVEAPHASSTADAAPADAGTVDAMVVDTSPPDASPVDAALMDATVVSTPPQAREPADRVPPCTGVIVEDDDGVPESERCRIQIPGPPISAVDHGRPRCVGAGTRSEMWIWDGGKISWAKCRGRSAVCKRGRDGLGWYDGRRAIVIAPCAKRSRSR